MMAEERLQKIIARSGLCSRRDADQMIADGRVTIDGRVAEPGERANPGTTRIKVDGRTIKAPETLRHLLLYKPRGVMTTCDDPENRKTVLDLVRSVVRERVYPVGRLDYHSEGLLILTNDGELAAHIAHPRHGVVREYLVKIRGASKGRGGTTTWWRVEVTEGRTHEVREFFFRTGRHAQRLRRTAIGPLRDNSLKPGEFRTITESELKALRKATSKTRRPQTGRPARPGNRGPRKKSTARKRSERKR
jgi:16S rRNA U516 pseudouridylate synthase RsuA-like enzyme